MKNNILLIGSGSWGQNYIKTLSNFPNVNLTVANRENWKKLIEKNPDGVIISTPPQSHIEIAKFSLERNIPTMIEKPLSLSLEEAQVLSQFKAPILVNYIHLFSDAYENIKKIVDPEKIEYIRTEVRGDKNSKHCSNLFDYFPHELAYILDLSNQLPKKITLKKEKTGTTEEYTKLFLEFSENFYSYTEMHRPDIKKSKLRWLEIESDGISIIYKDTERPANHASPLNKSCQVFLNAIDGKSDWRLGLELSFKILDILEKCEKYNEMIY